jgi:hypothetical protein
LVDNAPDDAIANEDVTPFREIVKLLEPVLDTVINPKGPEAAMPEVNLLLSDPEIEPESALMVKDEVAKELVWG